MSDIFNKLNNLKVRLADLEINFTEEIKKEEEIGLYKSRMDKKLPAIREYQTAKVKFNLGNEIILTSSLKTILSFPYKLTLKDEIKFIKSNDELFIDSSESLFSPIVEMIRISSNNPTFEGRNKIAITCSQEAIKVHAKEYFGEDTEKVLDRFEFVYSPEWIKKVLEAKPKKSINKWGPNDYILCYSCGTQNAGEHWKKRCSYDRANDSYCIDYFIATCMTCDPSNTLTY